ncbi:hypothetical protein ES708_28279 [subsurface metagenome]
MWKEHRDWMVSRIKAGQRKAKKIKASNPVGGILSPQWIGFAERPLIEKVTGRPYEEVRERVLDFFVSMVLGGVKKP